MSKKNISRNNILKIQKKNILSRISEINLSLISIFESIWDTCNGDIAEFSFCNDTEDHEGRQNSYSYQKFEKMLNQISSLVKSFASSDDESKTSHHETNSVSPESGIVKNYIQSEHKVIVIYWLSLYSILNFSHKAMFQSLYFSN